MKSLNTLYCACMCMGYSSNVYIIICTYEHSGMLFVLLGGPLRCTTVCFSTADYYIHTYTYTRSSRILPLLKLVRDSTAVAEEPLHVCPARDVLNQTFTADWELVGNDRMSRMIAHTSHHLLSSKRAGEQEEEKNEHVEDGQTAEEIQQPTANASTEAFLAVAKPPFPN